MCIELEKRLNIDTLKLISKIQKEYPLTTIQRIKLEIVSNYEKIVSLDSSKEAFMVIDTCDKLSDDENYLRCLNIIIRNLFSLIIQPDYIEKSKLSICFSKYLKECIVEFFTYMYCVQNRISYDVNTDYIMFFKQLVDGFTIKNMTHNEISDIILRSSINNLLNLCSNGERLYEQFEKDFKDGKVCIKKEM